MNYIVTLNGVYDIACGLSILLYERTGYVNWLSNLHIGMFRNEYIIQAKNNVEEIKLKKLFYRLLAYWIITYGSIRLIAGLEGGYIMTIISYALEAICFEFENNIANTTSPEKVRFVSITSTIIAITIGVKKYYNNSLKI